MFINVKYKTIAPTMSILFESNEGWVLSHAEYINSIYSSVYKNGEQRTFHIKPEIFEINSPYVRTCVSASNFTKPCRNLKRKITNPTELSTQAEAVQRLYKKLCHDVPLIKSSVWECNTKAIDAANKFYMATANKNFVNVCGGNSSDYPIVEQIDEHDYIFPPNSNFCCKDVKLLRPWVKTHHTFDVILMDPPWWNKYIRRKKSKVRDHCYRMMYNEEFLNMPVNELLAPDGLVLIWCTNSETHIKAITTEFFPTWNIDYVTTWFWLKITKHGEPVCNFSGVGGKQPFERVIIGCRKGKITQIPREEKLIVSVPSSLHSHKPALVNIIQQFTKKNPKCLELFARYQLPGWTSWGLEVCKLQNLALYDIIDTVI